MSSCKAREFMIGLLLAVLLTVVIPVALAQSTIRATPSEIREVMRQDQFTTVSVAVTSTGTFPAQAIPSVTGGIAPLTSISPSRLLLQPAESGTFTLTIRATEIGEYNGTLKFTGGVKGEVPISLTVMSRTFLPVDALLMEVQPLSKAVNPGDILPYKVNLHNLLTDQQYNATLHYTIREYNAESAGNGRILHTEEEVLNINTSISLLREFEVPNSFAIGDFIIHVNATYLNQSAEHFSTFSIELPIYNLKLLGIELWKYILAAALLLLAFFGWRWYKGWAESKKRYHVKVDMKTLPKPGPRMAFLGKVAERNDSAVLDIDKLTVHCIVAGATGRGKSVAAQVLVEECLRQDIAVIVFDPTAQWSGMLRKCEDKRMLSLYPNFGMKKTEARAFNGNVRAINHAREIIDIPKYAKPGEIHIFTLNKLEPEEIDIFVANTVRTVFKADFDEAQMLKILIVYDEVHRLLPRFGGTGEGFIQIERACREFRKWGIGVMLVSQVLSDFMGEIKANINTEIQLRTADEGDLSRISTKYGEVVLKSLIKAPVGTCMFENPSYNHGNPYFIAVRPVLHGVRRLTDDDLEQYNKYNDITDDLDYQVEQLEELGLDIFDLRLELKLAVDKIKTGNFNMVEIYLEGLTPRIQDQWKKLGKKPKKRKLLLVGEDELKAELEAARKDHDEAVKEEKAAAPEKEAEKILKTEKHAAPDAALTLNSGAIISSLGEMRDALDSMDESIFAQHVSEDKNELADWTKDSLGMLDVAEKLRTLTTRVSIVEFITKMEEKKEMMIVGGDKPPAEDSIAAINRLMKELEAALKAGKKAEAHDIHTQINKLYHDLPKETKASIFKKLTELSKKLRESHGKK